MTPPCGHNPPAAPTGPYRPGNCRLCWLWHNDSRYRALWGDGPPPGQNPAAPCRHLGERVRAPGAVRDYRVCLLGHGQPLGGRGHVVCGCLETPLGCRGCPDYAGDASPRN